MLIEVLPQVVSTLAQWEQTDISLTIVGEKKNFFFDFPKPKNIGHFFGGGGDFLKSS